MCIRTSVVPVSIILTKLIDSLRKLRMATSSEDVLLQVPQVRYKKGDGTLFLMAQRLAWIMENRDTVSISHLYADIKSIIIVIIN